MIAVVLRRGDNWIDGVPLVGQTDFDGHVAFVGDLRERGSAVEVGPLSDPGLDTGDDLVGLALLPVGSVEDARALMADDPMVLAGILSVRAYSWGTSALQRT